MCGRYALTASAADLTVIFDATVESSEPTRSEYNIAPTDVVPVVRVSPAGDQKLISSAHWGLLPFWERDRKSAARRINARAETVASSPVFSESFRRRRCLVPADGWYEWRRTTAVRAGSKQPYFMTLGDRGTLAFAGVWNAWRQGSDRWLTFSVLTAEAVGELAVVHDRMPLVLPNDRWERWLSGSTSGDDLRAMLTPRSDFVAMLEIRPVGRGVGDVRNGGPELVARVSAPPLDGG
jgi:putative SOS response-associated peptidase YedK